MAGLIGFCGKELRNGRRILTTSGVELAQRIITIAKHQISKMWHQLRSQVTMDQFSVVMFELTAPTQSYTSV